MSEVHFVRGFASAPPVVGKRNHFSPLQELVDRVLDREETGVFTRAELGRLLMNFACEVKDACREAYSVGAARGIEQVATLLEDPDYYATVKERRKRELQRQEEYQKQQVVERAERDHDPAYRERHIADIRRAIDSTKKDLAGLEAHLTEYLKFSAQPPKLKRMPIPETVPPLPGEQRPGTPQLVDPKSS
jgi:hypothetical protein